MILSPASHSPCHPERGRAEVCATESSAPYLANDVESIGPYLRLILKLTPLRRTLRERLRQSISHPPASPLTDRMNYLRLARGSVPTV